MKARENNWNPTNLDTVKQIVTNHSERGDIVANYKKPQREKYKSLGFGNHRKNANQKKIRETTENKTQWKISVTMPKYETPLGLMTFSTKPMDPPRQSPPWRSLSC